jgi:hypothetical protein
MMSSSQCSAQSVAILSGATETETKRIRTSQGFHFRLRPAKIIAGSGTPPPDENSTERKYSPLVNDFKIG